MLVYFKWTALNQLHCPVVEFCCEVTKFTCSYEHVYSSNKTERQRASIYTIRRHSMTQFQEQTISAEKNEMNLKHL